MVESHEAGHFRGSLNILIESIPKSGMCFSWHSLGKVTDAAFHSVRGDELRLRNSFASKTEALSQIGN